MPHGIGHPLGLQVMMSLALCRTTAGTTLLPVEYRLRCTRVLQPGMVLTIEPGIYFIESLLARGVKGCSANTSTGRKLKL